MATEEFKIVVETLFDDYVVFRKKLSEMNHTDVKLSFREYLDFYISYNEHVSDQDLDFDLEDLDSEEDSE